MKHHYNSNELAHIWVHDKEVDYGNCPGSMSFRGDKFYSYSTVIASRFTYRGKSYYVIDRASFSVTTSGHQSSVRRAIPDMEKVFSVYCGERSQRLDFTPQQLRDHYLTATKEVRPRNGAKHLAPVRQAEALERKAGLLEQALDVCSYFRLPSKRIEAQLTRMAGELAGAREVITARETKQEEARAKREALMRAKREASANEYAQGAIDGKFTLSDGDFFSYGKLGKGAEFVTDETLRGQLLKWLTARNAAKIQAWRNGGGSLDGLHSCPVMLRVCPGRVDLVQTSLGAVFPRLDAIKAYHFAKLRKAGGWKSNGEQCPVGIYKLDRVNEEGIIAGCHRITWAEVETFAVSQGWTKAPATSTEAPRGWGSIEGGQEAPDVIETLYNDPTEPTAI